jgi:hypothetical protein
MDHQRRVQVVLGEAERTDGLLRFVLEAEGFDIVGLASDDQELGRVLRGARPAVVVLDGGISAPAALEAKERSHGAALVVVWPDGVSAAIAEERVDPYEAIADLGDAVRRAVHRAELSGQAERREAERREVLIRIPEARDAAPTIVRRVPRVRRERPTPSRARGRRARVLVAAATWMLILTALTTIAMAVPNALGLFPGRGGARPTLIGSVNRRPTDPRLEEKVTAPLRTDNTPRSATCDASAGRHDRPVRSSGRAYPDPVRARGCPQDHGQSKEGTKSKGGGRPDDPGSKADKKQKPRDDRGGGDGSQETGGTDVEHGNAGGRENAGNDEKAGGAGKVKEHPDTANGGRSENGKAG